MIKDIAARTAVAGVLVSALWTAACTGQAIADQPDTARVERGQYLVTVGGCNDCHTPLKMGPKGPEPDETRMLSGHPERFLPAPVQTAENRSPEAAKRVGEQSVEPDAPMISGLRLSA